MSRPKRVTSFTINDNFGMNKSGGRAGNSTAGGNVEGQTFRSNPTYKKSSESGATFTSKDRGSHNSKKTFNPTQGLLGGTDHMKMFGSALNRK